MGRWRVASAKSALGYRRGEIFMVLGVELSGPILAALHRRPIKKELLILSCFLTKFLLSVCSCEYFKVAPLEDYDLPFT